MSTKHLTTYINDHWAGSVAALELIARLISSHAGTPLEPFFTELHQEVEQDRDAARKLLRKLDTAESPTRNTGGWIVEKLSRVKLLLEDSGRRSVGSAGKA